MIQISSWDETEEKTLGDGFSTLPADLYICEIINCVDTTSSKGSNMLVFDVDICEGVFSGYYAKELLNNKNENKKWRCKYYQTYSTTDAKKNSYLKGVITALEKSNNTTINLKKGIDVSIFTNKKFGGVFGQEEYLANDGEIKTNTKLFYINSIEGLKNAKVPPIKKLPIAEVYNAETETIDDDELPF